MRRIGLLLALLCCLFLSAVAVAESLQYDTAPHVIRPGKYYDIVVSSPEAETASMQLLDASGAVVYNIYEEYPLATGSTTLSWDGLRLDHMAIAPGEYTLRVRVDEARYIDTPLRIGAPYPLITDIRQSSPVVTGESSTTISFALSESGTVRVELQSMADDAITLLHSVSLEAGVNVFQWLGKADGVMVPAGQYALIFTLQADGGSESMSHRVFVEVQADAPEPAEEATQVITMVDITPAPTQAAEPTPLPTPLPTPEPDPVSNPYSSIDDGTFWAMTPGETDTAAIWDILMQPITVWDDGKIDARDHVYMMENEDGSGERVAQIHGKSQGLHVVGEVNEHGYVLVEAFSNYDPDYQPRTDEEKAHAFDLKRGYIKASGLKTVEVNQEIAFVIDKLTQRMYMYIDGEPVTEFLIATGKIESGKYYNETIVGEYITISHTGGFWSGNMYCDMAIRINGGILLHEVPHKVNADGTKNYSSFEGYLGTKQSHGCVRIQRLKTPEGYNHRWIWENLERKGGHKVIIWDDLNRVDSPTTWQENPKN